VVHAIGDHESILIAFLERRLGDGQEKQAKSGGDASSSHGDTVAIAQGCAFGIAATRPDGEVIAARPCVGESLPAGL
jgi:hypothetical protein